MVSFEEGERGRVLKLNASALINAMVEWRAHKSGEAVKGWKNGLPGDKSKSRAELYVDTYPPAFFSARSEKVFCALFITRLSGTRVYLLGHFS